MAIAGVQMRRGNTTSSSWRSSGTVAVIPFLPPVTLRRLQERQGEQHQRDVVVPAPVLGELVVIEAQLALGQLEVLLDRPAQAAHPGHLSQGDRLRRIRQVVLELFGVPAADRAPDHHPAGRARLPVPLLHDPQSSELVLPRALGPLGDPVSHPRAHRQRGRQLSHRLRDWRIRRGLRARPRTAKPARPLWDLPPRIAAPDLGRAADLEAVPLPELSDRLSEVVAVPVAGIPRHPQRGQSASPYGRLQHLQAQLQLALEAEVRGQSRPLPARLRLRPEPALVHVQPAVDQRVSMLRGITQEDADLAVADPAQGPRVLARHSRRPDPLLLEPRVVQDQRPVGSPELLTHKLLEFADAALVVPGRVAQELLQLARGGLHLLGDVLHVLALDGEVQANQVLPAPGPAFRTAEEAVETSVELLQLGQQRLQIVSGHDSTPRDRHDGIAIAAAASRSTILTGAVVLRALAKITVPAAPGGRTRPAPNHGHVILARTLSGWPQVMSVTRACPGLGGQPPRNEPC